MTALPITSILTAIAIVGLIALSLPVSLRRRKLSVSMGDGGDDILGKRVRTQANYVEYVPIALIALGLAEAGGSSAQVLWILGGAMIVGRVLHAYGMLSGKLPPRAFGMVVTWLMLLAVAGALVCGAY